MSVHTERNGGAKPLPCGCGGEAYARSYANTFHMTEDGYDHTVYCSKCNIETKMYDTEAEAVEAWNRAMGSAEEKLKAFWDGMSAEMKEKRKKGTWTNHEVACLLSELFGDDCACNYNGIDEWLPEKCELQDACPNPVGVACWEQFLKWRADR